MKKTMLALLLLLVAGIQSVMAQKHKWVDLGLPSGTFWATCNVGANSPEEYGDYFAWARRHQRVHMTGAYTSSATARRI